MSELKVSLASVNKIWELGSVDIPRPESGSGVTTIHGGITVLCGDITQIHSSDNILALRPNDNLSSIAACPHIPPSVYHHFLPVWLLMTPALPVLLCRTIDPPSTAIHHSHKTILPESFAVIRTGVCPTVYRPKFDDLRPNLHYYGHFAFVAIPSERSGLSRSSTLHQLTYHCSTCGPRIKRSEHVQPRSRVQL